MKIDLPIGLMALAMAAMGAAGGWWIYASIMGCYGCLSLLRFALREAGRDG